LKIRYINYFLMMWSYKKDLLGNKLFHADCLDILPFIEENSVDLILCDLPYGRTNCSWDSIIPLDKLWEQYERIIKPNGAILLFGQSPFDKSLGVSNLKLYKYEWIWEKTSATGHLNAKKMPMKAHENILVFYKKEPTYNPIMTEGHVRKVSKAKNRAECIIRRNDTDNIYNNEYPDKVKDYDSTIRYPRSVLKFKSDKQKSNLHKTQKPLELIKYFIKTYTNENMLVLDNAMGSGTTCLAAKQLNRRFIGIEKEKKYYDISVERIGL
jgi:DNA modification methylase